jgi:hypothetical protein
MDEKRNSMLPNARHGLRWTCGKSILAASEMTFALLVRQAGFDQIIPEEQS